MSDALFLICFSFSIVRKLLLRFPEHAWHTKDGLRRKPWAGRGGLAWPGHSPPGPSLCWELLLGETALPRSPEPGTSSGRGSFRLPQGCLADGAQDLGIADRPSQALAPSVAPRPPQLDLVGFSMPPEVPQCHSIPLPAREGARVVGCAHLGRGRGGARPAGSREPAQGVRRLALRQFLP